MKLPSGAIQSLIFLKLVVAGHATIFRTRTYDWFWKRPFPSVLLHASFWSAALGTPIVVHGFMVTPVGWKDALWIWCYALTWFLVNDVVKIWTYRLLRARGEA